MGTIFAVILAGVLFWAAVTKLRDRTGTATGFEQLGLPGAQILASAVPVVEVATAFALVAVPGWGGVASFALLAGFTVVLVTTLRSGRMVACRCFGGTSDAPVTRGHLLRNAGLMVMAVFATVNDRLTWPSMWEFVVAFLLLGVGAMSIRSITARSTVTS